MSGENGLESRLITVDFPATALRSIISAGGGIDTPLAATAHAAAVRCRPAMGGHLRHLVG